MKLIENIDTYYFTVKKGQTALYLPKDRPYAGRLLTGITVFDDAALACAPNGDTVVPSLFVPCCTLNLYDEDKRRIVNDYALPCVTLNNLGFALRDRLNYDISEIRVLDSTQLSSGTAYALPVCVEYKQEDRPERPLVIPTDSYTFAVQPADFNTRGFLLLSDLNVSALFGKKVKKITAQIPGQPFAQMGNGALTLREKGGRVFNQVPLDMLRAFATTDDIYFDNYEIDFYNSYIECGTAPATTFLLTFYF